MNIQFGLATITINVLIGSDRYNGGFIKSVFEYEHTMWYLQRKEWKKNKLTAVLIGRNRSEGAPSTNMKLTSLEIYLEGATINLQGCRCESIHTSARLN